MSGNAIIIGNYSYSIDPTHATVQLSVGEIENNSPYGTGTIRLELWLTNTPWNPAGSNSGYEIAVDRLTSPNNGTLAGFQYLSNISSSLTYSAAPSGTYYITLAVAEYTGNNLNVDNGFVIDSQYSFQDLLLVNLNGSVSNQSPLLNTAPIAHALVGSLLEPVNTPGISLSSLFSVSSNPTNPLYLDVVMADRVEYPGNITPLFGTFWSGSTSAPVYVRQDLGILSSTSENIDESAIVFTYQTSSGRYFNATYGYFDQLTFHTGNIINENAEISIFTTNNLSVLNAIDPSTNNGSTFYDAQYLSVLSATHTSGVTYDGTIDVVNSATALVAPVQATPNSIVSAAQSFIGHIWNNEGCWVLASNISAIAGASLPPTSMQVGITPIANGEWIVAYYGGNISSPSLVDAESNIRSGDVVSVQWGNGAGGHIFTVVSGSGANAMIIDNAQTGTNSANDGTSSDIIIGQYYSVSQEFAIGNAIPSSVAIYRLDTPTISINGLTHNILAGKAINLSSSINVSDAGGAGSLPVTQYAFYSSGTGSAQNDLLSINGVLSSAHTSSSNPLIISASDLANISLVAANGSGGVDTVYVRAYNGSYWGDWASILVSETPNAGTVSTLLENALNIPLGAYSLSDTTANISSNLDLLENDAPKISSITLTDAGSTLSITAAQLANDSNLLGEIVSNYLLSISGLTPSNIASVLANNHVTSINLSIPNTTYQVTASNIAINGTSGIDTIAFNEVSSNFTVAISGSQATLTDHVGTAGTDSLSNVERLQFSDSMVGLDIGAGQTSGAVFRLYQAALNRTPDTVGLGYWIAQMDGGTTLNSIAQSFIGSTEFTNLYGAHPTDTAFVVDLYANVLHRAPDPGGQAYWLGQLANGEARSQVLAQFSESSENIANIAPLIAQGVHYQLWH